MDSVRFPSSLTFGPVDLICTFLPATDIVVVAVRFVPHCHSYLPISFLCYLFIRILPHGSSYPTRCCGRSLLLQVFPYPFVGGWLVRWTVLVPFRIYLLFPTLPTHTHCATPLRCLVLAHSVTWTGRADGSLSLSRAPRLLRARARTRARVNGARAT